MVAAPRAKPDEAQRNADAPPAIRGAGERGGSETAVEKVAMEYNHRTAALFAGVPYPGGVRDRDIDSHSNWYIKQGQANTTKGCYGRCASNGWHYRPLSVLLGFRVRVDRWFHGPEE
jgi:hypothetical protein